MALHRTGKSAEEQWFFDPFVPDLVTIRNSAIAKDVTDVRWEDLPTSVIKREQQCWAFGPKSRWHGYAGYAEGYAMVDPNKLALLTPGIDRQTGEYLPFGVPATVVANYLREEGIVPEKCDLNSGIGVVIIVDQLPKLLGLHIDKTGFFRDIGAIFAQLPQTSLVTLAVSAAIVALIFGLERLLPRVPAPLVAVAAAVAASALLDLPALGVATVGAVPTGLPSVTWPDLALVEVLWPPAVGIALMSFTESIAAARAFAERDDPCPGPTGSCSRSVSPMRPAGCWGPCLPAGARHRPRSTAWQAPVRKLPGWSPRPALSPPCWCSPRLHGGCRRRPWPQSSSGIRLS